MTLFPKVYVDEDVDVLVATLLLAQGLDATTVRDREMLGKLDDEQLSQTFAIAFTQQFRSVSQKF